MNGRLLHLDSTNFHFDELDAQKHAIRLHHQRGNEPLIVEKHKYISFISCIILHMEMKVVEATFKMSVLQTLVFFMLKLNTKYLLNTCLMSVVLSSKCHDFRNLKSFPGRP